MVAASAPLAMIGCSKDWPFERTENGNVEIEGGGGEEPEGGIAYIATIYGTVEWSYVSPARAILLVRDANGVCIGKIHGWVSDLYPWNYDMCECDAMSTESPFPWTVYACAYDEGYDTWRMDSEVITSLPTYYNCAFFRKKAKEVNLDLYFPQLPDTTGPSCD